MGLVAQKRFRGTAFAVSPNTLCDGVQPALQPKLAGRSPLWVGLPLGSGDLAQTTELGGSLGACAGSK
jgi:hypothetical protein